MLKQNDGGLPKDMGDKWIQLPMADLEQYEQYNMQFWIISINHGNIKSLSK